MRMSHVIPFLIFVGIIKAQIGREVNDQLASIGGEFGNRGRGFMRQGEKNSIHVCEIDLVGDSITQACSLYKLPSVVIGCSESNFGMRVFAEKLNEIFAYITRCTIYPKSQF